MSDHKDWVSGRELNDTWTESGPITRREVIRELIHKAKLELSHGPQFTVKDDELVVVINWLTGLI